MIATQKMSKAKPLTDVLGMVLCGGRASRMDGQDKGLVNFRGKSMASYAIDALAPCQQIIINANRNQQLYQTQFQLPVISDEHQQFDGPLAGLLAALRYSKQHHINWVISVPCDAPLIDSGYVHTMWAHQLSSDKSILMAADDYRQPVFSLLHISLIEPLAEFLAANQQKIILFYEAMGYETVKFENSQRFININSPEDIARYE